MARSIYLRNYTTVFCTIQNTKQLHQELVGINATLTPLKELRDHALLIVSSVQVGHNSCISVSPKNHSGEVGFPIFQFLVEVVIISRFQHIILTLFRNFLQWRTPQLTHEGKKIFTGISMVLH